MLSTEYRLFHLDRGNNHSDTMNLQLIKGEFTRAEAFDILTQLVAVKIRFHEGKIEKSHSEEDIKMREQRIRQLQQALHEVRRQMTPDRTTCRLEAEIIIG